MLVEGQKVKIFWLLPATLSLEGVYFLRCPPHCGTLQAPQGLFDLFGMIGFTVGGQGGRTGRNTGLADGRNLTDGACGWAGTTRRTGAFATAGGTQDAVAGLGWIQRFKGPG